MQHLGIQLETSTSPQVWTCGSIGPRYIGTLLLDIPTLSCFFLTVVLCVETGVCVLYRRYLGNCIIDTLVSRLLPTQFSGMWEIKFASVDLIPRLSFVYV